MENKDFPVKDQMNIEQMNTDVLDTESTKDAENVDKTSVKVRKNTNSKRRKIILATVLVAMLFLLIGFAWYYYMTHRPVDSDDRAVMSPYYLYLLDANGKDYLNLTVGNLHPGETKQVVIGVTNKDPKGNELSYTIGKESEFNYQLELAYTKNLPLTYKVYELAKINEAEADETTIKVEEPASDGKDAFVGYWKKKTVASELPDQTPAMVAETTDTTLKNNKEMYGEDLADIVNLGQYDVYEYGADHTSNLKLNTTVTGSTVNFDLDYYLIELNWDESINFSDYTKETDLIYVLVNALQLKPEKSGE